MSASSTPTTSSQPPVPRLELSGKPENQVQGPCTARTGLCLRACCTPRTGIISSTSEKPSNFSESVVNKK